MTYLSIMSPAFFEAFSIALRRACKQVSKKLPSMKFRATDAYRDFTGVTFSHSPVDVVGQGEFAEIGQNFVANLEGRDVGWNTHEASVNSFQKI